ncbi:hypothetical protein ABIA31_005569 [Catenulispora sp. MAP5-51]|uniref:hypothetical protein n=1 Tax=Catenulispora sp. MAP5-51 TaxID=3156298 RepID=UPI003518A91B
MNDNEEFDGSALRELLSPAVADRGLASAPTDAIVAAGRRRVVGRRTAVAGGALAIVAAVPLGASAIAAGPGTATHAAGTMHDPAATPTRIAAPPHSDAPAHSDALAQTEGQAQTEGRTQTEGQALASPPQSKPAAGESLPGKPIVIDSGTVEGVPWSMSALATPGNNALTAKDQCLGLTLTVNGHGTFIDGNQVFLPYCLPVQDPGQYQWAMQYTLQYYYVGGKGTLQMGMVPADVATVVTHVDGLAPVTTKTVPAPGFAGEAFYFASIPKDGQGFRASFDEYNAQGVKTGSFNNWTPTPPGK